MNTRQKIINFMAQNNECVIATVGDDGQPQAATVGFSATSDLELTFGTSKKSRKYKNIIHDPKVAIVVGFKGDVTVQCEGIARELKGEELAERKKLHFKKIPTAQEFESDPEQTYLAIQLIWARYTNYVQAEPIEELRQFS